MRGPDLHPALVALVLVFTIAALVIWIMAHAPSAP
jgi:uncharacterized membrane protein